MNTKNLMIASTVYQGIIGFGLTFLPNEISELLKISCDAGSLLIFQILGAVYLGFAMLNWMLKNSLIGGMYGRPLITGNLVHFLVSSFALIKSVGKFSESIYAIMLSLTIIYCAFTLCFLYVFMNNPKELSTK